MLVLIKVPIKKSHQFLAMKPQMQIVKNFETVLIKCTIHWVVAEFPISD